MGALGSAGAAQPQLPGSVGVKEILVVGTKRWNKGWPCPWQSLCCQFCIPEPVGRRLPFRSLHYCFGSSPICLRVLPASWTKAHCSIAAAVPLI